MKCPYCNSEDVRFLKGRNVWICFGCEKEFDTQLQDSDSSNTETPAPLKVFFSYGHPESEVVNRLKELIEHRSNGRIDIWLDTYKIAHDDHWRARITEGLNESDRVVGYLSKHSMRDPGVCRDELGIAVGSKLGMISTVLLDKEDDVKPPAVLTERQWIDMSDWREYQAKGEEAFCAYLEKLADRLIELLCSKETAKFNAEVLRLKRIFGLGTTDEITRIDIMLKREMVGRQWLKKLIDEWKNDKNGSRVLVLWGKPGAGKSMFSAHYQFNDPNVVATLACDYRSDSYSSVDMIIDRLAYRLALRMPDYRAVILHMLCDNPERGTGKDRFNRLITEPLSRCINGNRDACIILIDGLDEAKTTELLDFIVEYSPLFQPFFRFIITSRKETHIESRLKKSARFDSSFIDLSDCSEQNDEDIRSYYIKHIGELLKGRPRAEAFMQRLVKASDGIFYYAETIAPQLREDILSGADLSAYELPQGLDELLLRTMERKFGAQTDYTAMQVYKDEFRTPLSMIAASPVPLPVSTLKQMMRWSDGAYRDFVRILGTLLDVSEDICLFHKSFGDWLNTTTTAFCAPKEDGVRALAEACNNDLEAGVDRLDDYELIHTTMLLRSAGMKPEYAKAARNNELTDRMNSKADECSKNLDHGTALYIYLEYAAVFEYLYSESGSTDDAHNMIWGFLGASYEQETMLDHTGAGQAAERALKSARQINGNAPNDIRSLLSLGAALGNAGGICEALKGYSGSRKYYEEYLAISRGLAESYPDDPRLQINLGVALSQIGVICEALKDYSEARKYYEEALAISRGLAESCPDVPRLQRDLGAALGNVGSICKALKDYSGARKYYEECLTISRRLAEKYPDDPQLQRGLGVALSEVGDICKVLNDYSGARKYYEEDLAISCRLAESYPDDPQLQGDLGYALKEVGDICEALKDYSGARKSYEERLAISCRLAEKYPDDPRLQRDLGIALEGVGGICKALKDYNGARKYYEEHLAISRRLAESYPEDPELQRDLGIALERVGGIFEALKGYSGARKNYDESLAISRRLAESYPDDPLLQSDLGIALNEVGGICNALNDYSGARKYYEESLAIFRRLAESYPDDTEINAYLADILHTLALLYKRINENEAKQLLLEAAEISKRLYRSTGAERFLTLSTSILSELNEED